MKTKKAPGGNRGPTNSSTPKSTSPGTILLAGDRVYTPIGTCLIAPTAGPADEMLSRLAVALGDNGLILIGPDEPSWEYLTTDPKGWQVTGGPAWFTATLGGTRLRLGILHRIDVHNDPLLTGRYPGTVRLHHRYASLVGVPFYGDGGTAGALLMDDAISVKGSPPLRAWHNEKAPRVQEPSWPGPWSKQVGKQVAKQPVSNVQLDKNAYYLAAANSALLPLDGLTWRRVEDGHALFGSHIGLWRVQVPPNPQPRLPHPFGAHAKPGAWAWIAQPTMDLINELGVGVEVSEAWLCPRERARRALVPWYERLRDARRALQEQPDADTPALSQAVKDTYSRGIGCLDRDGRRWFRPDWRAILYAQARTCMWRAMWRAGSDENRWPAETRTDMVVYEGEAPGTYRVGSGMGEWKVTTL